LRRLLIISGSKKVQKDPSHPIPALNRLGGNSAKVLRKFYKKSKQSQPLDVLMLSPVYGLVMAEQKMDFIEPIGGEWDKMALSHDEILKLREPNLSEIACQATL